MLCTNTDRLKEVFINISHDVDVAGTTVNLDGSAVLKDIVNTEVFAVPAKSQIKVYTQAMEASDNNGVVTYSTTGEQVLSNELTNQAAVDENGVVRVSGFDYEHHYVMPAPPAGVTGQKLIVEITGLTPKEAVYDSETPLNTNNGAGIYAVKNGEESKIASVEVESPTLKINAGAPVTYVVDFSGKMVLARSAKLIGTPTDKNGVFKDDNGDATYQLKYTIGKDKKNPEDRLLTFNGVDTAKIFGKHTNQRGSFEADSTAKDVTVVPASSVYIDDSLKDEELVVTDGHGYTATVPQGTEDVDRDSRYFTFEGTGIDVYCTTHSDAGYVSAALYNGNASDVKAANVVTIDGKKQIQTIKNYSHETLYNVPTVSFRDLPYGLYTVKVFADSGVQYKLDGVRVYGVVAESDKAVYDNTTEQNAQYFNLREYLLNNGTEFTAFNAQEDITQDVIGAISGLLYLDKYEDIVVENKTEAGEVQKIYKTKYEAYDKNSPKNEIYLTGTQGVSFVLNNWSSIKEDAHVYIGLSTPRGNNRTAADVKVNDEKLATITSATDMYYEITSYISDAGVITIQADCGNEILSLTNLKVTGATLQSLTGKELPASATGAKLNAVKRLAFAPMMMRTVQEIAGTEDESTIVPPEEGEPGNNDDPETPVIGDDPETPDDPEPTVEPTPTPTPDDDQSTKNESVIVKVIRNVINSITNLFRGLFRR